MPNQENKSDKKFNDNLAELYGAMIGDGCLSRFYASYDNRERSISLLTGHSHDEPYYRKIIRPILLSEFGVKGCIQYRKRSDSVILTTSDMDVFKFFEENGFPIGKKNQLSIPERILNDNVFAVACVRGIFDTDGSIYRRYSKIYKGHKRVYDHKVIQIRMRSLTIIRQIHAILCHNHILPTKITWDGNCHCLRITNQEHIIRFMDIIRPHNLYHTERFLKGLQIPVNHKVGP